MECDSDLLSKTIFLNWSFSRALVGCNGDLEAMNLGKTRIHNDVPQSQIRSDSDVPFVGHVDHGKEKVVDEDDNHDSIDYFA